MLQANVRAEYVFSLLLLFLVLLTTACASQEEQASEPQPPPTTPEATSEDTSIEQEEAQSTTTPEKATQLKDMLAEKNSEYVTVSDTTGALSVEAPPAWTGVLRGIDSEVGSNWSSFAGVSIESSLTVTPDLHAWHNTSGAPGLYAVASRSIAQEYSDDELVTSGPNDFSSSCEPGARRSVSRPPYSGKAQAWDCGEGHSTLTLSAAPENRECVVLLQVAMYDEADVDVGQHILDTFDADCARVVEDAAQEEGAAQEGAPPGPAGPKDNPEPEPAPTEPEAATSCVYSSEWTRAQAAWAATTPEEQARILSCPVVQHTPGFGNHVPPAERVPTYTPSDKSEKPELIPTPHGPVPASEVSQDYRDLWEQSKESGENFGDLVRERYGECFGFTEAGCAARRGSQAP